MTSLIPITLQGRHLGERHRFLNTLVSDAYKCCESFDTVMNAPESTPVDRLFKIELASKYKHVDYILTNLRDDDMLYVTRALKCKWLLDDAYRDIINPNNLETVLYPEMMTTAVTKMKHWIHLNLRDPIRCQEFYEYYCDKDMAIKFLVKCPQEVVERECPKWLNEIAPEYFKVLCERSSLVAKIFFKLLLKEKSLQIKYFKNKAKFFEGLKCILKARIEIFLDIIEQIKWKFLHLSPQATKYVIKHAKHRYLLKPELYVVNILHIETLAQYLSPEECEELVLKLARAKFLEETFQGWFSYKSIEPLINRLDVKKQVDLKKRVFVEKNVGDDVKVWPYPITEDECDLDGDDNNDVENNSSNDIFQENEGQPDKYDMTNLYSQPRIKIKKMHCKYIHHNRDTKPCNQNTLLDMLFDEYRFMTFDQTFLELRKKMAAEGVSKNRMFMILVLVSKTDGKMENLRKLFQLLIAHRNEPAHVRAAIIRSLVKRACVWRVTEDIWKSLLIFGQELGLDGTYSTCDCDEGFHAVVIRSLLSNNELDSDMSTAFLTKFSTLNCYSLSTAEKDVLVPNLVKMIVVCARTASSAYEEGQIMINLLDTLTAYNRKVDLDLLTDIKRLAAKDKNAAHNILQRLFKSRIGRKELFRENFALIQTADSYMNTLKHNTEVLSPKEFVKLIGSQKIFVDSFLKKLSIYFAEKEGVRESFLNELKNVKFAKKLDEERIEKLATLARALVILIAKDLPAYIIKLDAEDIKGSKLFSALIRGQAHVSRPALGLDSFEWRSFGAKHIATRVLVCRQVDVDRFIKQLLMWKRTARLAIILSKRTKHEIDTLEAVANIRPTVALKTGLSHILQHGDYHDPRVWEIVKHLMVTVSKKSILESYNLKLYLKEVEKLPLMIKPEFVTLAFSVLNKFHAIRALPMICHIKLLLPNIETNVVDHILVEYLNKEFTLEKITCNIDDYNYTLVTALHLRILGKYLLLCKTEECQTRRFDNVGQLYLDRLATTAQMELENNMKIFLRYTNHFLNSLKYTEVFLNVEYVDCLPVMWKIAKWMQSILPIEQYFKLFVDLHLTMSYFRAIRKSVTQVPEVFADKEKRLDEGGKIVGEVFGKYVSYDAHELRQKYNDSVIELYSTRLSEYIIHYFNNGAHKFLASHIMKGLLSAAEDVECYLAVVLFNNYHLHGTKRDNDEIHEMMKQRSDITSQFMYRCAMVRHRL